MKLSQDPTQERLGDAPCAVDDVRALRLFIETVGSRFPAVSHAGSVVIRSCCTPFLADDDMAMWNGIFDFLLLNQRLAQLLDAKARRKRRSQDEERKKRPSALVF